jgi:DNA helicase INO80
MIHDSGKMTILDKLLANLKVEGHRVLIYSQMTRVIDLLEEFMGYRRYKYIRLDGSSRISDRRDMVADFQSK